MEIMVNANGTKRLVINGANIMFSYNGRNSMHSKSELDSLVATHKLVLIPLTHRSYILHIGAASKNLAVRVSLFKLDKQLPGVWFSGEVAKVTGDCRTFPCYFTMVPVRKKRGVYDFCPIVNIIHNDGSDLSMYKQIYDTYEPISESRLRRQDFPALCS